MSKEPIATIKVPLAVSLFDDYTGPVRTVALKALNKNHGWDCYAKPPEKPSEELVESHRVSASYRTYCVAEVELFADGTFKVARLHEQ